MLGQIDFKPWQCLAELIDNSVDAFLTGRDTGHGAMFPKVSVEISTRDEIQSGIGQIKISDNAPGMDAGKLEKAVRAGYSGNSPVDKLGLFGMGFNVATARMGGRTEIWTTTADDTVWQGIRIDFDELEAVDTFVTPLLVRPKLPSEQYAHGTEIIVSKLEQDRALYLRTPGGSRINERQIGTCV